MRRLQRHGLLPLSDKLRHVGERLTHRLGVKQAVRFAQSALVEVPAVVGYLRPMVLLPASAITGLSAAEIELILAHELAHVRRHDSLVNLAQTVIEALLFYHPGMWWISNEIRKERENCCDDVAVALSRNRVRYLQALARLEEQRSAAPSAVLAATGGPLLARVRRLLGQPTNEFGYYKATAGLAGLVTVGFVAAALAMNQAPREAPENSPEERVEETVEAGDLGEEAANHTVRPVEAHQSTVGHHELRNLEDAKAQARSADHGPLSADNPQSSESVDSDKSADATSFRLPTAPIEQSHRLAAAELSKPKELRDRRPAGLEDLESPQAVQRAVEQAMRDLANLSQSERKWTSDPRTRLRYLGDQAFDALVDGIRGDNRVVAVQSCHLLSSHGERAVPPLISVLATHTDEGVRAAAASALGQTYHPSAFQPLLDALEDESQSVRINACGALGHFRDARAIAPLSKRVGDPNGHVARNSIQWIRQPLTEGPAYWPSRLLKIRKLTVDAKTLKGEQFGQPEIDVLVEHLQSKYWDVRVQCLHALAALNARQSIPQIIASRHCNSRAHVLAQMPTPTAVDALVKDLGSGDKHVKEMALSGIAGGGGRWAAPLLIAMLDDASMKRAARKDELGLGISGFETSVTWPEWHMAHTALCQYFWEHGLPGEFRNLYQGETNDVPAEIVSLRKWWKQHGEDFLAGRHVPNPKLTTVGYHDP